MEGGVGFEVKSASKTLPANTNTLNCKSRVTISPTSLSNILLTVIVITFITTIWEYIIFQHSADMLCIYFYFNDHTRMWICYFNFPRYFRGKLSLKTQIYVSCGAIFCLGTTQQSDILNSHIQQIRLSSLHRQAIGDTESLSDYLKFISL